MRKYIPDKIIFDFVATLYCTPAKYRKISYLKGAILPLR
jgi:hypothetical protein